MAGYDIGPRIGIEGEKEFNDQIKKINNSLREYGSEMKALSEEFRDNANSQQALVQKSQVMEKQLDSQRKKSDLLQAQYDKQKAKLKDLATALQQVRQENGENSKEAQQAENAYNKQADAVTKLSVSINETKSFINRLTNDLRKNSAMLDEIDQGARDAATGLSTLSDSADQTSESLDSIDKGVSAGNLMDAADTLSGIGDAIIDAGEKAVSGFATLESATTRVNTYFGLTGDAAEQMGGVIENVFRSGVTDSLDKVADAVITVNNNLKDLNPESLEIITNQAINLEQVFGSDMNESMRGVNALMTNFGLDAQTAMDYLVTGTQNGLDKTQELGDNLSEYSGKFAQAGYSAEEYFQLLQNGLEGGAYNLDRVNDSINEVTTRLSDGTIADSMDSIDSKTRDIVEGTGNWSKNTEDVFKAWQAGSATQKDVINAIVDDIASATNQQDALNKASIAFGSLGEDANMEVIASLTTLGDTYGDVSGAAQNMADSATTPMQTLQAAMNELQLAIAPVGEQLINLATQYLPPIIEGITNLVQGFLNLPGPIQTFIGVLAGVLAVFSALAPVITAVMGIVTALGTTALAPIIGIIAGVTAAITAIILVFQNWESIVEWFGNAWNTVFTTAQNIFNTVVTAIKGFISDLVTNIQEKWEAIKTAIGDAMTAIQTTISNIWNNIKSTISDIINAINTTITNTWNAIKTAVTNTVNSVKTTITNVWNAIKTTISSVMNAIRSTISSIWNGIKSTISSVMNSIRSTISNVWNGIRNTVSSVVNSISSTVINIFQSIRSGISSAMSGIYNAIVSGFNTAINFIKSLPGQAVAWGRDFVNGLKNGIMAGVNGIVNAVKGVANKIRSFLHFSRPDEGPLRDYETWMPDFMKGIATGIYDNMDLVQKAVDAVSGTINTTMQGSVAGMVQSAATPTGRAMVIEGDKIILDGKEIGRTAKKYITLNQRNAMASKGRRA